MATDIAGLIKESYPGIDWDKFEDIDRAINWELWHGTLPDNYWTEVEPLKHYEWRGFDIACADIIELLGDVDHEMWLDGDSDCLTNLDPDDDEYNWAVWTNEDGIEQWDWIGGENWSKINLREVLMHTESYRQVF